MKEIEETNHLRTLLTSDVFCQYMNYELSIQIPAFHSKCMGSRVGEQIGYKIGGRRRQRAVVNG